MQMHIYFIHQTVMNLLYALEKYKIMIPLVIEISTLKKNLSFPSDVHSRSKLLLADQPALKGTLHWNL